MGAMYRSRGNWGTPSVPQPIRETPVGWHFLGGLGREEFPIQVLTSAQVRSNSNPFLVTLPGPIEEQRF